MKKFAFLNCVRVKKTGGKSGVCPLVNTVKKHPLFALYVVFALCYVMSASVTFLSDVLFMQEQRALTLADFELVNAEVLSDMSAVATSNDPQLIYTGDSATVRSLSYRLTQGGTGVVCAYYTVEVGQDFSNYMCEFPQFGQVLDIDYLFPSESLTAVRLDIGSIAGETFVFEEITINTLLPLRFYFLPSGAQVLAFLILPMLCYVFGVYLLDFYKTVIRILKTRRAE